jgi:arylsulfatase
MGSRRAPEDIPFLLSIIDELGGPRTYNHNPVGWAQAMATPFGWMKQVASHFGGTRNGMVISWPKRIKEQGGLREQFHHVIDIAPTVLEAVGVEAPLELSGVKQKPIEGVSLLYSFDDAKAPGARKTQYFELAANRALYHDGWVACTTPKRPPWVTLGGTKNPADEYEWALYHVDKDFSQTQNLAKDNPHKLRELQDMWWAEAAKYNVLPLDDTFAQRADPTIRPSLTRGRTQFTYYPGMIRITEAAAPATRNLDFSVTWAKRKARPSRQTDALRSPPGRAPGRGVQRPPFARLQSLVRRVRRHTYVAASLAVRSLAGHRRRHRRVAEPVGERSGVRRRRRGARGTP